MNKRFSFKRPIGLRFNVFDIVALVFSLCLAIGVLVYVNITSTKANQVDGDRIAVVYVKNEAVKRVNLEELKEDYIYTLKQNDHPGMISDMKFAFSNTKGIAVTYSNCKDHTCINMGYVNEANSPIVCLPNGVYVVIEIDTEGPGGMVG